MALFWDLFFFFNASHCPPPSYSHQGSLSQLACFEHDLRQEKNKPSSRVAFLVWGFVLVARCLHLVCCTEGAWHEAKNHAQFGHRKLSSPWCPNKRNCWPVTFHSLEHQDRSVCGVQRSISSGPLKGRKMQQQEWCWQREKVCRETAGITRCLKESTSTAVH